jgi:hypothetical protein
LWKCRRLELLDNCKMHRKIRQESQENVDAPVINSAVEETVRVFMRDKYTEPLLFILITWQVRELLVNHQMVQTLGCIW